MDDVTAEDRERLRAQCTRSLTWHGSRTAAAQLAELPDDIALDRYGDGGVVTELETEVASLLGTEGAVFLVSGTMAQQIALRIHADHRGRRTVLFHPTCHLALHENHAMERLHGLHARTVGDPRGLLTLDDLEAVAEQPAALLLELPQREIGGRLPAWDDLVAQVEWARDREAAVHLDGARLWQCGVAWDRSLEQIAGLFDTTYVSFYKDLGGLAGCALAGPEHVLTEVREWRHRHGGTLFAMWPYAASALAGLRQRLPRMSAYRSHALAIADALRHVDGVRLVPDPPQTSLFHLHLRGSADDLQAKMLQIARDDGLWTWPGTFPSDHPDWQVVELTVGDATLEVDPTEVADVFRRILAD